MGKTVRMKSTDAIKLAYVGSGAKAATNYKTGVAAVTDWVGAASSAQAETNWQMGVTAAAAGKLRSKGIAAKCTNESWKNDASTKGGSVIGQRIMGAGDKFAKGYTDTYNALNGLVLPDHIADDPLGNLSRIAGAVVKAEVNAKRTKMGLAPIG